MVSWEAEAFDGLLDVFWRRSCEFCDEQGHGKVNEHTDCPDPFGADTEPPGCWSCAFRDKLEVYDVGAGEEDAG